MSWSQILWYALILAVLFLFVNYDYKQFFVLINFIVCALYIITVLFKFLTVALSVVLNREVKVSDDELAGLGVDQLPVYTILVPLYRESGVAESIVKAIQNLDYPRSKLDVRLLLEVDDEETAAAVDAAGLPDYFQIISVPEGMPRTKPRACNHGLQEARGEYLVIYDAEDRPERDQLKKAAAAFSKEGLEVVCLQAKLNYYNPRQNALTKWFTMEYSVWFDLFLPGLHLLGIPIPLGGTSNHFRTEQLKKMGGWDPFNVTEDCDLGVRLHRAGFVTKVLDSTTWEEANCRVGNWIRQRSRWVKGYIQTHFVHTRKRFRTMRGLGLWGYGGFLLSVGGLCITLLLNPVYWAVLGFLAYFQWQVLYPDDLVSVIFYQLSIVLALGNVVFILINVLGCVHRRMFSFLGYALLSPFYWILMSLAAWKGLLQIIWRPFYWEKTRHGLSTQDIQ
ncbi:glycosyltransferase [Planctomycetota bacterium]